MKYILYIAFLGALMACKENHQQSADDSQASAIKSPNSKAAIALTMEGQTHTMNQEDLAPIELNIEKDSLMYSFRTNDSGVSINLNLTNTGILEKGTASYSIPEVNSGPILVDLSFFNKDRDVNRTNKRIVFKKGTINIQRITSTSITMDFKGEGSGMIERGDLFPIKGTIDITY